jgi:hypothetical protein
MLRFVILSDGSLPFQNVSNSHGHLYICRSFDSCGDYILPGKSSLGGNSTRRTVGHLFVLWPGIYL